MGISKKIRFEIFRRDRMTCQYCGGRAPDVALQVDHVIPIALGGTDCPSNLVTACVDCNAGKNATALDSPVRLGVGDEVRCTPPVARYEMEASTEEERERFGPDIVIDFNDPFVQQLWNQNREPFSRHSAQIDLARRTQSGEPRSLRELAKAWGWSKTRVRDFLATVNNSPFVRVTHE